MKIAVFGLSRGGGGWGAMRASFLGFPIDVLAIADTVELAGRAMRSQQRLEYVALKVARQHALDPVLAADVAED
jgi:hypothetical protein